MWGGGGGVKGNQRELPRGDRVPLETHSFESVLGVQQETTGLPKDSEPTPVGYSYSGEGPFEMELKSLKPLVGSLFQEANGKVNSLKGMT